MDNSKKKTETSINFKEHNLKLRKVMEELSALLKETPQEQPEAVKWHMMPYQNLCIHMA